VTSFIELWDTKEIVLPSKAMNIKSGSTHQSSTTRKNINIPVIIRGGAAFVKNFKIKDRRHQLIDDVVELLEAGDDHILISNQNSAETTKNIIDILKYVDFEEIKDTVQCLNLCADRYTKTRVSERMVQSLATQSPCESLGFSQNKNIVFWLVDEQSRTEWFQPGDLLLTCLLDTPPMTASPYSVPKTIGKEVFRKNLVVTTTTTTTTRIKTTKIRKTRRTKSKSGPTTCPVTTCPVIMTETNTTNTIDSHDPIVFANKEEKKEEEEEEEVAAEEENILSEMTKTDEEKMLAELANMIHNSKKNSLQTCVKKLEGPAFIDFRIYRLLVPLQGTTRSSITDRNGFGTIAFMLKEKWDVNLAVAHGGTMYRKEGERFIEMIEIKSISW
jgi:hypothetical protein